MPKKFMIMAANDYEAFRVAAVNDNTEVLELLLNMAESPEELHEMLAVKNYEAFRKAAAEGNIEVLKLLLNRAESSEERCAMLAANNYEAFREAANNGGDIKCWSFYWIERNY